MANGMYNLCYFKQNSNNNETEILPHTKVTTLQLKYYLQASFGRAEGEPDSWECIMD